MYGAVLSCLTHHVVIGPAISAKTPEPG